MEWGGHEVEREGRGLRGVGGVFVFWPQSKALLRNRGAEGCDGFIPKQNVADISSLCGSWATTSSST